MWICALVEFFAFVCFVAPWQRVSFIKGPTIQTHLFHTNCCQGGCNAKALINDCGSLVAASSISFLKKHADLPEDSEEFDEACITVYLKGSIFEDLKDAGAAAFFFLLVGFFTTPLLQYV